MTEKRWFLIFTTVMTVVVLWFMSVYHKWDATWGIVPVLFIALLGSIITWRILDEVDWFEFPYDGIEAKIMMIPAIGIVLSLTLGIQFAEPTAEVAWSQDEHGVASYNYDYAQTRGGYYYNSWSNQWASNDTSSSAGSSRTTSSSRSSKGDGEAILVIALIVLAVALVCMSAFIPHFWVVSCVVLLTVMARIAWREHEIESNRGFHRY